MIRKIFQKSITLVFCLIVGSALADTRLPAHYPNNFVLKGTITKLNYKQRVIYIDYATYKVDPVHTIHTAKKNRKLGLFQLKKGMKVGVTFSKSTKGKHTISSLWVLPKSMKITPQAR